MGEARTYRLRDPVHGLIMFYRDNPLDQLAWALLNTPEMQRLRRIKQLGVSEFVFPGATHTRLAHSIGVFHTARLLAGVIKREKGAIDEGRSNAAIIAALLHDVGHGPFSHTFEGVAKAIGHKKRHEQWTGELIRNPDGAILPLLNGFKDDFAEEVAQFFDREEPTDIYHSIVSSSFDADRLDYLRRDRMMTGTGAGAIDFDWLMVHLRVAEVPIDAPDPNEPSINVPTFCLDKKALPAAEHFLLARYTLHEQVYFHKVTRCVEKMIGLLLKRVAELAKKEKHTLKSTGLGDNHPLITYFRMSEPDVSAYMKLDDTLVLGALSQMTGASDERISDLARRLLQRDLYKTLDLGSLGLSADDITRAQKRIRVRLKDQIAADDAIEDSDAKINIYTRVGGDDEKMHKKLHILDGGTTREVIDMSRVVAALKETPPIVRYMFKNDSERRIARESALGGGHGN